MAPSIPLALQTAYADLLERCAAAASGPSPVEGSYASKQIRGVRYWYFQESTAKGRAQKYIGPETPELAQRIDEHRRAHAARRDRRALVSTLVRSAHLPRPVPAIGDAIAALAGAGLFQKGCVLVGTAAYQTYAAMLGHRLSGTAIQTADVDVARYATHPLAAGGPALSMIEVLHRADSSFRAIPHRQSRGRVASYQSVAGVRVDFLAPNLSRDTDAAVRLSGLGTDAQPLRFLDFLIQNPEPAVVLYGEGIYVAVPSPARFAVHKLIVARRRPAGAAKRNKDLLQVEALLPLLAQMRKSELGEAWREAVGRGKKWRQLLDEGLALIDPRVRSIFLDAVTA